MGLIGGLLGTVVAAIVLFFLDLEVNTCNIIVGTISGYSLATIGVVLGILVSRRM